jgi:purine-binding chemotaxis protein CheW
VKHLFTSDGDLFMTEKSKAAQETQYLTFHLAGEEYAVGILAVKEIIPCGALTKVPQTPASICGVINLRGNVVPVVDLAVKFGLGASALTHRSCIVIVEVALDSEPTTMGILADSVSQVMDFSADDVVAPPVFGTRVNTSFLLGMGRSGSKFVLLLNIDRALAASDAEAGVASAAAGE